MQFNWCRSPVNTSLLLQRHVTSEGPASDGNPLVRINLYPIVYSPHLSRSISGTRKVKINYTLFLSGHIVTMQEAQCGEFNIHTFIVNHSGGIINPFRAYKIA